MRWRDRFKSGVQIFNLHLIRMLGHRLAAARYMFSAILVSLSSSGGEGLRERRPFSRVRSASGSVSEEHEASSPPTPLLQRRRGEFSYNRLNK
jgi:hypothetical protein